jgi:predicted RecB family nuclease
MQFGHPPDPPTAARAPRPSAFGGRIFLSRTDSEGPVLGPESNVQRIGDALVFSPGDLVGSLACAHLPELELAALAGLVQRPVEDEEEMEVVRRRGLEHERRHLADLETAGRRVTRIELDASVDWAVRVRRAAEETEAALRRGDDVIHQATLFDGRWLGFADVLLRVERRSALGAWSYEVLDAKLARHAKASAVLQVCAYADALRRLQGHEPELLHLALGGSARPVERLRVADYMAYYRLARREFEARTKTAAPAYPPASYPEPVEHCAVCRWDELCTKRRRDDDDLSLIAGIAPRQRQALKARGVATRRGVADLALPLEPPLADTRPHVLDRLQRQARLQVAGQEAGRTLYEIVEPSRQRDGALEPNRGLLALPEPRPGDLFFDIEGDPYALDDGVDYLFGVLEPGLPGPGGQPTFHAFWARDPDGRVTLDAEKRAFDALMALFMDRLERDPSLHIYHYAAYEAAALGRLMGRHGIRENDVDRLFRDKVLVDLYRVVRQGVRASVESYSIKKMEPLYGFARDVALRDANASIEVFERWLQQGGDGDDEALRSIERYNRDDVVSTRLLRDWLEGRRAELAAQLGEDLPRFVSEAVAVPEKVSAHQQAIEPIVARLVEGVPAAESERTREQHAGWLLAQLLSWHRREEKSFWWRYYHLMGELTDDERIVEREPIGRLEYVADVRDEKQSRVYRYRFPPQEHAIGVGDDVHDPATGKSAGKVVALDDANDTVDLKRGIANDAPHPTSLVPCDFIATDAMQQSLLRIATWLVAHGIDAEGPYRAARDILLRALPRTAGGAGGPVRREGEDTLGAAVRTALALDESTLAIQGPPGSGKTYTGAQIVLALVAAGKRVGVTANSHKVIGHFLDEVVKEARQRGRGVRIGQKEDAEGKVACASAKPYKHNHDLLAAIKAGALDVVGGTAWVWSRPEFADALDVLVVDEAGQIALANALAVSPAARSLVLLGDPQQLDQPLKGTHPPGAERSALAHLLDGAATMPEDRGLFLDRTWRLHPDVCAFTSEVFYEDRLQPREGLDRQALEGVGVLCGTGTRFVPVPHVGNRSESVEEARVVADLVRALVVGESYWTDRDGERRRVSLKDVLIVAPYNAQVAEIARLLPGAHVGTVDKFQGQEAAVSIYSMATSSPADAPRGMEFLYSLNRQNVATSRARCLTVLVASPELLRVHCRTPRQMRLVNALCRLVEGTADRKARPAPKASPSARRQLRLDFDR